MNALSARLRHPDFAPALDDGLISTFLTRVDFDPGAPEHLRLTFGLRGRTWPGAAVQEDWEVRAEHVVLQVLHLGRCPELSWVDDHPLLEEMCAEWGVLRGLKLPPDTRELEALLQRFGAAAPPLSQRFAGLHTPDGQPTEVFAFGPLFHLRRLRAQLIRHNLMIHLKAQGRLMTPHGGALKLLRLGVITPGGPRGPEALVLAQSFHAARLP